MEVSGKGREVTVQSREDPAGAINQVMYAIHPFFLTNIGWMAIHFRVHSSNDIGIIEYVGKELEDPVNLLLLIFKPLSFSKRSTCVFMF